MPSPQSGVFALGTAAQGYLELDRTPPTSARTLVEAVAGLREPRTVVGGVNLVVGVRPSLWSQVAPDDVPAGAADAVEVVGTAGYRMPATQHDVWVWVSGASRDLVFDVSLAVVTALRDVAVLAEETTGWSYHHSRDLTGFQDGTENPSLLEAPAVALDARGNGVVLVQKWRHDTVAWAVLPTDAQERVMGRTKADSVELAADVMPADSHVTRTSLEQDGEELAVFRRNTPYGSLGDHGTLFVGFSADQHRLDAMLRSMAGADDGVRDALTRYTTPLTGAYYCIPSLDALAGLAAVEAE